MANFSVWLGGIFLVAFAIFGAVQSTIDIGSTGTGLVVAERTEGATQTELNLCMNRCMRSCVTNIEDEDPCTLLCERDCESN